MQTQAVRLSALALVSTAMVWSGPVRGEEPAPFDWTGYYIGAHMGSGHGDTDVANPYKQTFFGDRIPTQEALVGLQGGYNWQLPNSRWVFGAEGE
jgi:opacity protein-like surface antigen